MTARTAGTIPDSWIGQQVTFQHMGQTVTVVLEAVMPVSRRVQLQVAEPSGKWRAHIVLDMDDAISRP